MEDNLKKVWILTQNVTFMIPDNDTREPLAGDVTLSSVTLPKAEAPAQMWVKLNCFCVSRTSGVSSSEGGRGTSEGCKNSRWQKHIQHSRMFSCETDHFKLSGFWQTQPASHVIWLQLMLAVFSLHKLAKNCHHDKVCGDAVQPSYCESLALVGHISARDNFRP